MSGARLEQAEIEFHINELEVRVDRLRALYDQYFSGLEKLEPLVPRKDVERRMTDLRRIQIRNTGQRFRFQTIVQRYNTYQTYWQRICRQIENGTYKRDVLRAKARFGSVAPPPETSSEAMPTSAGPGTLAAARKEPAPAVASSGPEATKGQGEAPEASAWERDEHWSLDASLDDTFARLSVPPPAVPRSGRDDEARAQGVAPARDQAPPAGGRPPPLGTLPPPGSLPPPPVNRATTQVTGRRIIVQRSGDARPAGSPSVAPARPNTLGPGAQGPAAQPSRTPTLVPGAFGHGPAEPRGGALVPSPAVPPPAVPPPAAPPAVGPMHGPAPLARPGVPPGAASEPGGSGGASVRRSLPAPVPPTFLSQAPPPVVRQVVRSVPPGAAAGLGRSVAPETASPERGAAERATPEERTPPPAPSVRPPGAPAYPSVPVRIGSLPPQGARPSHVPSPAAGGSGSPAERDLPPHRVREIYSQYVQARRAQGESTANITMDGLAKSLRETSDKLRQRVGTNKSVDFEVTVKDGKTVLKPIVK